MLCGRYLLVQSAEAVDSGGQKRPFVMALRLEVSACRWQTYMSLVSLTEAGLLRKLRGFYRLLFRNAPLSRVLLAADILVEPQHRQRQLQRM